MTAHTDTDVVFIGCRIATFDLGTIPLTVGGELGRYDLPAPGLHLVLIVGSLQFRLNGSKSALYYVRMYTDISCSSRSPSIIGTPTDPYARM